MGKYFLFILGALQMNSEQPALPLIIEIGTMYWNCFFHLHPKMSKIYFFAWSTLVSKNPQGLPLFCFRAFSVCLSLPLQIPDMIWPWRHSGFTNTDVKWESYHHRWIFVEEVFFACTQTNLISWPVSYTHSTAKTI